MIGGVWPRYFDADIHDVHRSRPRSLERAFSLIELILVVVIIGIIGAVAVPRLGGASERAKYAALSGTIQRFQKAIDLYTAEHSGICPATEPDGQTTTNGRRIVTRLISKTNAIGTPAVAGTLGPYLQAAPVNPMNQRITIRVDGALAGQGTHGWRYDSVNKMIESDARADGAPVEAVAEMSDTPFGEDMAR